MRTRWFLLVVCGSAILVASPRIARVQPLDMERALVERFGLSAAELGRLRGGQVVVKAVPARRREIAVGGAVRVPDDKERLVRWIRDVEDFRKAAELGVSRRLSSPPTINDFGDSDGCSRGCVEGRVERRAAVLRQNPVRWTGLPFQL